MNNGVKLSRDSKLLKYYGLGVIFVMAMMFIRRDVLLSVANRGDNEKYVVLAFVLISSFGIFGQLYLTWSNYILIKDGMEINQKGIKYSGFLKHTNNDFMEWKEIDEISIKFPHLLIVSDGKKVKSRIDNLKDFGKITDAINEYKK